jgi:hypothetical protein
MHKINEMLTIAQNYNILMSFTSKYFCVCYYQLVQSGSLMLYFQVLFLSGQAMYNVLTGSVYRLYMFTTSRQLFCN